MKTRNSYNGLRWTARIIGTLMVLFTLFMFIGEMLEGQKRHGGSVLASFSPLLLVIFTVWGISLAGLILAIWKEGLGGIISLICFILMFILNLFNKEASMKWSVIPVFLIFSTPSILYLVYWKLKKDVTQPADKKI
jgi:Na+/melibiose symporter-like transporter